MQKMTSAKYISTIQDKYHSGYVNVKGDGFCSYRCLAHSVYDDETRFWEVKMKMRDTLLQNNDFYINAFSDYIMYDDWKVVFVML